MGADNGRFFEDFRPGEKLLHPTPRTLDESDASLYLALTGDRSPLYCSDEFARAAGLPRRPLHDLLVFNVVLGKSIGDVSLNAIADLGFADLRFQRLVYPGDTLRAVSTVLGLRESSSGTAGTLWVRTTGYNQREQPVLSFAHWLMLPKRDPSANCEDTSIPHVERTLGPGALNLPEGLRIGSGFPEWATGGRYLEDYEPGERIDHGNCMSITGFDRTMVDRLYQHPPRRALSGHEGGPSRASRQPVHSGHAAALARAMSFKGLENGLVCLAWDAASFPNAVSAEDDLFAWSQVLEKLDLPGRDDAGALRTRLVALRNLPARGTEGPDFPLRRTDEKTGRESYHPNVVLDLEQILLMPRRPRF
jgi:2-methylfumaryl-CoA hydratase